MLDKMNAPDIVRDDDPDPELHAAHNLDPEALISELLRHVESLIQTSNKASYIAQDLHELAKGISDATETPIPQSSKHYGERSLRLPASSSDSSNKPSCPF